MTGRSLPYLKPLNARERRAVSLWGGILLGLGLLDYNRRGDSTLSEAHRALRRRVGNRAWTVLWGSFAVWFWRHIKED